MDAFWLNSAFYQAFYSIGKTGKNPSVGCLLVKENKIVGIGSTSEGGRPHAEENAIKMAGKLAFGATMYVTLEPCNLDGNDFSCTKQIINNGIKKVVIASYDPNLKTYKKGYNELISKGVEVVVKQLSLQNFLFNYSQLCTYYKNRPMIALKMATSLDGNITNINTKNQWITSKFSRNHVQQIRSFYDSVLIGTTTMLKDNPSLNARINGYKSCNTRILLDKKLKIKISSNLFKNIKQNPLIIFTSNFCNVNKYKKVRSLGANVYKVNLNDKGKLSLDAILKIIKNIRIKNILVEGGAKIATSFLNKKLIDIIYLYRSNSFIGKNSLNLLDQIKDIDTFKLYNKIMLEDDQLEIWVNKKIIKSFK